VSITFPDGYIYIFDAGTGIKPLANELTRSKQELHGTLFLSHPHWDHINFIPFFSPFFAPDNVFNVVGCPVLGLGVEQLVANQMGGVHFPITSEEFKAQLTYVDIGEGRFRFGPAEVETMFLCHPGRCLGYAVEFGGKKICYVTDNELFPEESDQYCSRFYERLVAFVREATILIIDSTYFDHEYEKKMGWGHSSIGRVCELAHRAQVEELCLFHHDPDQDDRDLERKLALTGLRMVELGASTKVRLPKDAEQISWQIDGEDHLARRT
jgi:phosphoribosyl 1,2-cyclic phosphodiesterase